MDKLTRNFLLEGSVEIASQVKEKSKTAGTSLKFSARKGGRIAARLTVTSDDMGNLKWDFETRLSLRMKGDIFYVIKDVKGRKITYNGAASTSGHIEFYKLSNGFSPMLFENQSMKYKGEIHDAIDNIIIFRKRIDSIF